MRSRSAEASPDAAALEIDELGGAPRFVDAVAGWLHAEWYAQRGEAVEIVRERLTSRPGRRFPARFVASVAGAPVGTFTLEPTADPAGGLLLFCLSNVFVAEAWRGRGIGRQLCEAAALQTRALRIPRLSLFTASHGSYYAAMGWRYVRPLTMRSRGADVPAMLMSRDVDVQLPRPLAGERAIQSPTLAPTSWAIADSVVCAAFKPSRKSLSE